MAGRSSRGWLLLAFCSGWLLLPATVLHAGEKEDCLAAWEKARALETKADYPAAAREYELALAPRVFGPDAENTATILNNLAELYRIMGQ